MKKLIITFTITFFLVINLFSQTVLDTDGLNNSNNVFLYSLKVYCKSIDSINNRVIYVIKDDFIGDIWPKKIKCFEIKYLENDSDYITVIKENHGGATIVRICPFEFQDGQFSVGVIPFSATYRNRNLNLINGGGLTVFFDYDSEKKRLKYKNNKWSGI